MKKLYLLLCLFIPLLSFGQSELKPETEAEEEQIFIIVEQMPEYPGGNDSLFRFLRTAINYPEEAIKKGIEGTVYINFIVRKTGEVTDAHVVRKVDELLDNEALRVVSLMPHWNPGMQRGKPVDVKYTIPIKFKL